jgi:hypothetical protein
MFQELCVKGVIVMYLHVSTMSVVREMKCNGIHVVFLRILKS